MEPGHKKILIFKKCFILTMWILNMHIFDQIKEKRKCLLRPGNPQWRIYYQCLWMQLSTICNIASEVVQMFSSPMYSTTVSYVQ